MNVRWYLTPRHMLTEGEAQSVVALCDQCNAFDTLDLKLTIPTFAQEDPAQAQRPQALLVHSIDSQGQDDALIGFCSLDGGWRSMELCGMVAADWRRQGIGSALLTAALDVCKANGIHDVLLLAEEASAAGKAFALTHGGQLEFAEHRMELRDFAAMSSGLSREPLLALRQATQDETGTLAHIQSTVFGEQSEVVAIQASIEQEFTNPEARFYLAMLDGQSVSSLKLYVMDGRASIYGFGVLPAYRRRGLAWQTLALLTEQLQGEGISQIGLEVETNNTPAVELYQACGFRPTTTYGYYRLDLTT